MSNWNKAKRNETYERERNGDKPPYSRIFVVCSKTLRKEDLEPVFEKYGDVEKLYMPRDRNTGESKGIAYIKYFKTSSAAAAIKHLHMTRLENSNIPIKVMVASNNKNDNNLNTEKYLRLFIKVSKDATESEIKEYFDLFGPVESVHIQKDKVTDKNRGFAYVIYKEFTDAAKAYEECDKKYKPVFATPKEELKRNRNSLDSNMESCYSSSSYMSNDFYKQPKDDKRKDLISLVHTKSQAFDTVSVTCSPQVPQKCIENLFNIIPGMINCHYTMDAFNGYCKASIKYESEKAAVHAVERLHMFEFPSGEVIHVTPEDNPIHKAANNISSIVNNFRTSLDSKPDLRQLADAIAQASDLFKAVTEAPRGIQDYNCSVTLPPPQPLASINSKVAQRCFLVFKPQPPPIAVLIEVFSSFGDLIDVCTFPNKTFGFAKYASVQSAQKAIQTLHGATLCGVHLKVLEADERPSHANLDNDNDRFENHDIDRKRMKLDKPESG